MNNTNRVYENGTLDKAKLAQAATIASQQALLNNRKNNASQSVSDPKNMQSGVGVGAVAGTVGAINGMLKNKEDNPGSGDYQDNPGSGNYQGTSSKGNVTVSSGGRFSTGTAETAPVTPAEPKKTVADYYQEAMNATNDRLKQAYEYQQEQLRKAQNDAFREAYIKQQMVERGYPEQLAAAGINGGAAQGVIARNNADYANQRTSIYNNLMQGLSDLGQNYQQGIMQSNENYLANMAAYQQALDQMEKEFEYNKQLAAFKASLRL